VEGTEYTTDEAILKKAGEIIGIPLGQIDSKGRLSTGKGAIGTVVEESWFGYKPNSESEPDFPGAGVELKVTPYIKGKNGIRAKERLVCNIINYMEEYDKTFLTSSFWHKCNKMLLMSYEHKSEIPKSEFKIDATVLFQFPDEDLVIIEQDWEKIISKIRQGKAHEISEGDTLYLAACTKGATSADVRKQPFSETMAKQRAYSLKSSYMTQILRKYVYGNEECPKIIKNTSLLQKMSFEDHIVSVVSPYYGKTVEELKTLLGVDSNAKNLNELLLAKMFRVSGRIAQTEEFLKAGIVPKTIRVQKNGHIKESMSFPTFDFIELSKETEWEESKLYNYLAPKKFLFVIFKEEESNEYVFDKVMFWNIPNSDLIEVEKVWKKTVDTLNIGVVFTKTSRGVKNNLPKQSENRVAHVRPHGIDSKDVLQLPDGRHMTKQCFWLNNTYIESQIFEKE